MNEIDPAFLVEAEILLQEGKLREAAVLCTRGLAKYPEYYTAYAVLIRALDEMGDYVQMQEVYDSAPNVIKFNVKNEKLNYFTNKSTQTNTVITEEIIEQESEEILELAVEVEAVDEDISESIEEQETIEIAEAAIEEQENIVNDEIEEEIELVVEDIDEAEIEELEDVEEITPNIEKEINKALRNDALIPEVVSDLTKSEKTQQEEIDIKETLTLAKIYEQQDAFSEALIIYKQLQEITADKSKFADKILELQTLVDVEKK